MGAADVVPGVSGGTMAFILGIYTQLIDAIRSFDLKWARACLRVDLGTALQRPHFAFLVPLMIGIFSAIIFFTRVVPLPRYIDTFPERVYGLFFGLVVGSIIVLFQRLGRVAVKDLAATLAGVVLGALVVCAVPTETPETWWFVAIAGSVAICAMIVPGISGSFILLILGKYAYVLNAIGHFDFTVIIPFGLGAVLGLVLFSRLLSWLLHHYERAALLAINGVLMASLWMIWPFQERVFVIVRGKSRLLETTPQIPPASMETAIACALAAVGLITVLGLQSIADRRRSDGQTLP